MAPPIKRLDTQTLDIIIQHIEHTIRAEREVLWRFLPERSVLRPNHAPDEFIGLIGLRINDPDQITVRVRDKLHIVPQHADPAERADPVRLAELSRHAIRADLPDAACAI